MARYPVIAAGQRVTAGLLASMQTDTIRKLNNTDRVNSTMTDDPELTAALVANAVYEVEFELLAGGTTTADIRTAWTVPASATGLKGVLGPGSLASEANADNVAVRDGVHSFATIINYSGVRNSTTLLFRVYERGEITTTTAGTLALSWAQVTANATASRVAAGSIMRVRRIG